MIKVSLSQIADYIGVSTTQPNIACEGISIDTRKLIKGNLFIAIVGDQFDGHDFIATAYEKGASAALVSRPVDCSIPQLVVTDTVLALGKICKGWRDRFNLPLIGVTGSNGKTTLKNMIAAILKAACRGDTSKVLATEGNFNNYIGLPITLSQLNEQHQYAVIEMGMNHFGEIDYLTKLARPNVAVINNAAAAHLEGLGDVFGVAKAKGEIFAGLPHNGVAVLNKDDPHFAYWQGLVPDKNIISFGFDNSSDVTAKVIGASLTLNTPKGQITLELPLLGRHNALNALAATAAVLAAGIELSAVKAGLEAVQPAKGRLNQHCLPNGSRIIDDTYNANPFSSQAAIETLAGFPGMRILVLGDMKELGEEAYTLHAAVGKAAFEAGIHSLYTLGDLSQAAAEQFGQNAYHFTDANELTDTLFQRLQQDATLLIKGSRSMHMEKIVAGLLTKASIEQLH